MLCKPDRLTVSKALVRSMKSTHSGRDCSTLFSWSCLSQNTMSDVLLKGLKPVDPQVEFCQQSNGLWAREDEQKLSRQYTKAKCHDSCYNPYDRPCLYRVMMLVSLKSSGRHRLFQYFVKMRKSTVSRGLPPFFKISGGCHLAQEISCSWGLWLQVSYLPWWKGCAVLERQVAAAGWITSNSWHSWLGIDVAIVNYPTFQLGRGVNHESSASCELRGHFRRNWADGFPYSRVFSRKMLGSRYESVGIRFSLIL